MLVDRSPCVFSLPGRAKGGVGGQRNPDDDREPTSVGAETGLGDTKSIRAFAKSFLEGKCPTRDYAVGLAINMEDLAKRKRFLSLSDI